MLTIMLFAMMHNAFPHVHHEHKLAGDVELRGGSHHHHHDSDHHHHPGEGENDRDQRGLLSFLFENQSHSEHTHPYAPATFEQANPVKQPGFKSFPSMLHWNPDFRCTDVRPHRYALVESLVPDHPYLPDHPHRGPPALG